MIRSALLGSVVALVLVAGGCGNDAPAVEPDAGYNCDLDDRDEAFTAGMEKVGARGMTFRLLSSSPAPPERGDNGWVVEVLDDTGAPLGGATLKAIPFMPDHGHISGVVPVYTPDATVEGRYAVDPVNLFMPGVWEIKIQATPAGGTTADRDEAVFVFCIAS